MSPATKSRRSRRPLALPGWRKVVRNLTPRQWGLAAAVVVALGLLLSLYRLIDVAAVHAQADRLHGGWVFAAIAVLPLAGFPVSVLHVVAGVRFGIGLGLLLVGVSIAFQLLASYALVRVAPAFFARRFTSLRKRLPHAAHRPVTLFTLLLPGVPYFAKNYVLPLIGVPLSTYLVWCFPIHVLRSTVGVVFGDVSENLTPLRIGGFVLYAAVIVAAFVWAFRNLQRELRDPRSAGDGPRRSASGPS